ncbi:hypothetical protein CL614_10295 [archaeon]|nr:hypothetical protein [archaeon]
MRTAQFRRLDDLSEKKQRLLGALEYHRLMLEHLERTLKELEVENETAVEEYEKHQNVLVGGNLTL